MKGKDVVAVIGILATLGLYSAHIEKAHQREINCEYLNTAVSQFRAVEGRYPVDLDELTMVRVVDGGVVFLDELTMVDWGVVLNYLPQGIPECRGCEWVYENAKVTWE